MKNRNEFKRIKESMGETENVYGRLERDLVTRE